MEQLNSEIWQYISLCGKYSGFYTQNVATHTNQFKFFLNNIEKLQMRYIEEQYVKVSDDTHSKNATFVPPSNYKNELVRDPLTSPNQNEINQTNIVVKNNA